MSDTAFAVNLAPSLFKLVEFLETHRPLPLTSSEIDLLRSCSSQTSVSPSIMYDLLNSLARLTLHPDFTRQMLRWFRPLIIDFANRWVYESAKIQSSSLLLWTKSYNKNVSGKDSKSSPSTPSKRKLSDSDQSMNAMDVDPDQNEEYCSDYSTSNMTFHELVCHAFGKLLPLAPQIQQTAVAYFRNHPPPFNRLSSPEFKNAINTDSPDVSTLLPTVRCIVQTTYRLVTYSPSLFISLWNWSSFYDLLQFKADMTTRSYAAETIATINHMSDHQRQTFLEKCLKTADNSIMDYETHRLLRVLEQESLAIERREMFVAPGAVLLPNTASEISEQTVTSTRQTHLLERSLMVTEEHLSPQTVDVCGVLLPRYSCINSSDATTPLVMTRTTQNNLRAISLAVSMASPILLEGVTGAGKTSLVEELARRVGKYRDIVKIHLGDQTDGKVLLGTYVSTSAPGSFQWQPGVLSSAVMQGKWVIIEDINMAPADVVSILIPLLETRELFIASRGQKIKAADGFQLFATKTIDPFTGASSVTNAGGIGDSLWTKVRVQPLPETEMREIIEVQYPHLREIVPTIIDSFNVVNELFHNPSFRSSFSTGGRFVSTRDLMKWCHRIATIAVPRSKSGFYSSVTGIEEAVRDDILKEALDCFVNMIPNPDVRNQMISKLAATLDIPEAKVNYYLSTYIPNVEIADKCVKVGRVVIPKAQMRRSLNNVSSRPFAGTTHSRRLLEQIAVSIQLQEPILLVGETGTGKTTVIQHLADLLHQKLVVVNLSQQTDSSDLLGGFKPVDAKSLVIPLKETFDELFEKTFSVKKNQKFLDLVRKSFNRKKWNALVVLLKQAIQMAEDRFLKEMDALHDSKSKKRADPNLRALWKDFSASVQGFEVQYEQVKNQFLFSFIEGSLVKAVRNGHWILLDEINLASAETLESLSGLLQDSTGSLLLTEKGDHTTIPRHQNFRIFGCMNPATDVGKKDLPIGLRNRFTEIYVDPPDRNIDDLKIIVESYLASVMHIDSNVVEDVVDFYTAAKKASKTSLFDSSNLRPHFSMRSLARSLSYATSITPTYGLRRSLYEGICMTFLTQLSRESQSIMYNLVLNHLLKGIKNVNQLLQQHPRAPDPDKYTEFEGFWLEKGPQPVVNDDQYIITKSVQDNLRNLARVIMDRKYPVLIQGPTSAGKTSMIEYLAKRTGHKFVRINNHEHTDLQEYVGTYISDSNGHLRFQEGVLVEALRNGYWIVLDELNLAPSDVLEALNRLLDDNRELFIPETQETVKPHPHFMLFATQNPPGLYGGRKALSRAFRNRFLELHFDEIPEMELETIIARRCRIAPSYCKKMISVYRALQHRRERSRIFEGKHGYITLRDLFRWANRGACSYYELAADGYMILAERIRHEDEKLVIKEVLETEMKVKIDIDYLYDCESTEEYRIFQSLVHNLTPADPNYALFRSVVWTKAMKRLFTLVARCIRHCEPVLLVGETGCGKTTVCQMLAAVLGKQLNVVNCHQHTETSDFLGSQRPLRNKEDIAADLRRRLLQFIPKFTSRVAEQLNTSSLEELVSFFEDFMQSFEPQSFDEVVGAEIVHQSQEISSLMVRFKSLFEWHNGPLVQSMKSGNFFLLDEISLADDSVLERLNSVLEPQRLLVLAERGGGSVDQIFAEADFQFLATMNPGGDYGKKELSPALRNRFTEIWVPQVSGRDDLSKILNERLSSFGLAEFTKRILDYVEWLTATSHVGFKSIVVSLRDILSWIGFMTATTPSIGPTSAYVHGGCMVFLDGLGANSSGGFFATPTGHQFKSECYQRLVDGLLPENEQKFIDPSYIRSHPDMVQFNQKSDSFGIYPFSIPLGPQQPASIKFSLKSPTTAMNLLRVLRAMQLPKSILLEGSPGVGKTSLISALASVTGHNLVRINLSEQTDLMDLFGSDLPVEGGEGGEFSWRDGPFLRAMKNGDWVLLDELNLASQSVLEGLNACLDHRGSVYLPELDRSFVCSPRFRIFAAQNPLHQGGGRKGLPKSFVNRFTQVYVEPLSMDDLLFIGQAMYPEFDRDMLKKMLVFNSRLHDETMVLHNFGRKGYPWEFNLRDVMRWLDLLTHDRKKGRYADPSSYVDMMYIQRFRDEEDRRNVVMLFQEVFGHDLPLRRPQYHITPTYLHVGNALILRDTKAPNLPPGKNLELLHSNLRPLQALMKCVEMNWLAIVTGPAASGKSSIVKLLAHLVGVPLVEYSMNSSIDTMELLGGFEQVDVNRYWEELVGSMRKYVLQLTRRLLALDGDNFAESHDIIQQLQDAWFTVENSINFQVSSKPNGICISTALDLIADVVTQIESALIILGQAVDISSDQEELTIIRHRVIEVRIIHRQKLVGKFEWVDGVLLKAIEHGHWILLDNVNFCSPSVIDRLNPLFEPNGVLMVNERGIVDGEFRVIKPHPDFRLFMTLDPQFGEISRAMRNRGVEISLIGSEWLEDSFDVAMIVNDIGIPGRPLSEGLLSFHRKLAEGSSLLEKDIQVRRFVLFCRFLVESTQRGFDLATAIALSVKDAYGVTDLSHLEFDKIATGIGSFKESLFHSPSIFPYTISARFLSEDSTLASVTRQISYFENILLSSKHHLETFSLEFILDNASQFDLRTRMSWLQHLRRKSSIPSVIVTIERYMSLLDKIINHPLAIEVESIKKDALVMVDLEFVSDYEPKDMSFSSLLCDKLLDQDGNMCSASDCLWEKYTISCRAFNFIKSVELAELVESSVYVSYKSIKVSEMSAILLSACANLEPKRLPKHELAHPILLHIYPFFVESLKCLRIWIEERACSGDKIMHRMDIMDAVLQRRNQLWDAVQARLDDISEVSTIIKWLRKEMSSVYECDRIYLSEAFKRLEVLGRSVEYAIGGSNRIWKHLHPQSPKSYEIFLLERKIWDAVDNMPAPPRDFKCLAIAEKLDVDTSAWFDITSKVVEAIATLYVVDKSDESCQMQFLDSLEHLPQLIRDATRIDPVKRDELDVDNITAMLQAYKTYRQFGKSIMCDYRSVVLETRAISLFAGLLYGNHTDLDEVWKSVRSAVNTFYRESISRTSRPPQDFVMYRLLLWISEGKSYSDVRNELVPLLHSCILSWYHRLWESSYNSLSIKSESPYTKMAGEDLKVSTSEGPLKLRYAIQAVIGNFCMSSLDKTSLLAAPFRASELKDFAFHISSEPVAEFVFANIELQLLMCSFFQFVHCYHEKLDDPTLRNIRECVTSVYSTSNLPLYHDSVDRLSTLLSRHLYQHLLKCSGLIDQFIVSLHQIRSEQSIVAMAHCWVQLGTMFVAEYVADIPFDPAAKSILKRKYVTERVRSLHNRLEIYTENEKLLTGETENLIIDRTVLKLGKLQTEMDELANLVTLRPEQSQILDIFNEVHSISKTILSPENVHSLLLTDSRKEPILQNTLTMFIDRLTKRYPMYRDFLEPIYLAVNHVKHGLHSLVAPVSEFERDDDNMNLRSVALALIRNKIPDTHSTVFHECLLSLKRKVSQESNLYVSTLLAYLQVHVSDCRNLGYLSADSLKSLELIMDKLLEVWEISIQNQKLKDEEEAEFYKFKTKNHSFSTDDQIDLENFKQMFPDYKEAFEDIFDDDDAATVPAIADTHVPSNQESKADSRLKLFTDEQILQLYLLHSNVIDQVSEASIRKMEPITDLSENVYDIAQKILSLSSNDLPSNFDQDLKAAQLLMASKYIQKLEGRSAPQSPYDFYKDSNVKEARKAEPILVNFDKRIKELLERWPEHGVLLRLRSIAKRIASFPVFSPLMKFLTGMELLIEKAEEWERYASREVSLRKEMTDISNAIIEWRKLELKCWPSLLDSQDRYIAQNCSIWWFHLYKTITGDVAESDENSAAESDRLQLLLSVLDQFIQSSSLGEFSERLKMIKSFARHCELQIRFSKQGTSFKERVLSLLHNLIRYYSQFAANVFDSISSQRSPIEKELRDYVKIAAWKDINVYALKQSAVKTHRQLNKCIKKYKAVLSQPITGYLKTSIGRSPSGDSLNLTTLLETINISLATAIEPLSIPHADHTIKATGTLKLKRLPLLQSITSKISSYMPTIIYHPIDSSLVNVEDLTSHIIEQMKRFEEESANLPEKKSRSILKQIRKKSFVDLLKSLRKMGLSHRTGRLMNDKRGPSSVFHLPYEAIHFTGEEIANVSSCSILESMQHLWDKSNQYYYSIFANMNALRESSFTHSGDLTSGEVERATGYVEHLLHFIFEQRIFILNTARYINLFHDMSFQLSQLYFTLDHTNPPALTSLALRSKIFNQKAIVDRSIHTIDFAVKAFSIVAEHRGSSSTDERVQSLMTISITKLRDISDNLAGILNCRVLKSCRSKFSPILTAELNETVKSNSAVIGGVCQEFSSLAKMYPTLSYLFQPTIDELNRGHDNIQSETQFSDVDIMMVENAAESFIEVIMVSIQELQKQVAELNQNSQETERENLLDEFGIEEHHLQNTYRRLKVSVDRCRLEKVAESYRHLDQCISRIGWSSGSTLSVEQLQYVIHVMQSIFPVVREFLTTVHYLIGKTFIHHKSLCKLTYVLLKSFTSIFQKGYCVPDADDETEAKGEFTEDAEGTGIGEGSGNKDVSNEIEEEDQVIGTENEEKDEGGKGGEKEDDAGVEMENDFDGTLENLNLDDKEDGEESEEERFNEDELDDEMGDVDGEEVQNQVDESMWDEEDSEKQDLNEADLNEDMKQETEGDLGVGHEQEMEEKNQFGHGQDLAADTEKQDATDEQADNDETINGEEPSDDVSVEDSKDEDFGDAEGDNTVDVDNDAAGENEMDENVENETAEGPEVEPEGEVAENNTDFGTDDMDIDGNSSADEGETGEETADIINETLDEDPDSTVDSTMNENIKEDSEDSKPPETNDDQEVKPEANGVNDTVNGVGEDQSTDSVAQMDPSEETSDEVGQSRSRVGEDKSSNSESKDASRPMESSEMDNTALNDDKKRSEDLNPVRSLGDALEMWKRRLQLEDMSDDSKVEEMDTSDDVNNNSFEHVGEEQSHDAQTLAPAEDKQLQENFTQQMEEESSTDNEQQPNDGKAEDETEQMPVTELPISDRNLSTNADSKETSDDIRGEKSRPENQFNVGDPSARLSSADIEDAKVPELLSPEALDSLRNNLQSSVVSWRNEGKSLESAYQLWNKYQLLTHDLAMELCESLRLILEPTLASKLTGDYRTGKRLNMKKIIPYIASQFRKDKIWLRRTKPSKRSYQIMISVDDSKSMSESSSIQLAYETLSLISQALTQLEIGDIGISSFGESIKILHDFGAPFTSDSGANVISQFTFNQTKTQVKSLIETMISLFNSSKNLVPGSLGAELWQLHIIISDGIMDDHVALRNLVRVAMEQRILIVFIVMDNKLEEESVLKMTNVTWGANGLEMKKYMDTFPFEFFVVLRDVKGLPGVLSDALRQFFSCVSK
ncbi:hypothetical protein BKA69DRAFT_1123750 [Paraphysoderma sedebokerense]|nr:hypothetical protein BKA69DRAFT_1123750 [Paraphysoderma sedebokerense]